MRSHFGKTEEEIEEEEKMMGGGGSHERRWQVVHKEFSRKNSASDSNRLNRSFVKLKKQRIKADYANKQIEKIQAESAITRSIKLQEVLINNFTV